MVKYGETFKAATRYLTQAAVNPFLERSERKFTEVPPLKANLFLLKQISIMTVPATPVSSNCESWTMMTREYWQ